MTARMTPAAQCGPSTDAHRAAGVQVVEDSLTPVRTRTRAVFDLGLTTHGPAGMLR